MNLQDYRERRSEIERLRSLMALIPHNRKSVLDVGSREGYITTRLADHFDFTVALDLRPTGQQLDGIYQCVGDVARLGFKDGSVDTIVCTEVLEHIQPDRIRDACREMIRVVKHDVIIGVPYREDTRVGKTTCRHCGKINPPWGHINRFDEQTLQALFLPLRAAETQLVGRTTERTNSISSFLMNLGGNPWGYYGFSDRCEFCGGPLDRAPTRSFLGKGVGKVAFIINAAQRRFIRPMPNWIHVRFRK